jgi:hypothetical protein
MYRRFESVDKDPTVVRKTQNFNLPVRKLRAGEYKGFYKIPPGSHIYTCFSSDFFHKDADELRDEAWDMMRTRSDCTFFMITKRPERIAEHLPYDWGNGWNHVTIAVTTENQWAVDKRLPIYLALPLPHKSVMVEPMLSAVNLRPYFRGYPGLILSWFIREGKTYESIAAYWHEESDLKDALHLEKIVPALEKQIDLLTEGAYSIFVEAHKKQDWRAMDNYRYWGELQDI